MQLRNSKLFLILTVILLIEILLLSIWTGLARPTPTLVTGHTVCFSSLEGIFLPILLAYKCSLLLWGFYHTFRSRNATEQFNESKHIAAVIYNWVFVAIVGIPFFFGFGTTPISTYTIPTVLILFVITASLAALFVPKIFKIYKTKFRNIADVDNNSGLGHSNSNIGMTTNSGKGISVGGNNSSMREDDGL